MRYFLILSLLLPHIAFTQEYKIGRLFTTPAERRNLDYLRQSKKELVKNEAQEPTNENTLNVERDKIKDSIVALQGFVKRNDGKDATLWINGKSVQEHSVSETMGVRVLRQKEGKVSIQFKESGKILRLKPGQIYQPESGRVTENLSAVVPISDNVAGE